MDLLSLGTGWADFMLPLAIRAGLILLCTSAVAWALSYQAARLRSLIWTAGLAIALLAPFAPYQPFELNIGLPDISVARLEAAWDGARQPAPGGASESAMPPAMNASPAPGKELLAGPPNTFGALSIPVDEPDPGAQIIGGLGLLWLGGSMLLLLRMLGGLSWHALRTRRLQLIEDSRWSALAVQIRGELNIRRPVRLLTGTAGGGPHTWGLLNPAVVIPPETDALDAEARRAVLRHELAHVARWDALWLTLERTLTAMYWWNPLCWLAARWSHLVREQACDDAVLAGGGRPSEYAGQLLEQARCLLRRPNPEFPALLPRTDAHLKRRISHILNPKARRQGPRAAIAGVLLLPLVLTACGASVLGFQPADDDPAEAILRTDDGVDVVHSTSGAGFEMHDENGALTASFEGEMTFGADDELTSISSGGSLTISDERGDAMRQITVEPGNAGFVYSYAVDGEDQAFDDAGRAWFDKTLLEVMRASGIAAEARVERLYQQGGVTALLDEVEQIPSDVVRALYLEEALRQTVSDTAGRAEILENLAPLVGAEFERSLVLMETGPEELAADAGSRAALLTAIASLDGSPVEQGLALERALPSLAGDEASLAAAIAIAADIQADFERAETLIAATAHIAGAGPALDAWIVGVNGITGDFERARALSALLGGPETTAALRIQAIEAAAGIDADFEKTELLVSVAPNFRGSEPERAAYLATVRTIGSEYDQGRALIALEG